MTTTLVTDWFAANYFTIDWTTPREVGVALYSRTPRFGAATRISFSGVTTLANLSSRVPWVQIHSAVTPTQAGVESPLYAYRFVNDGIIGLQLMTVDTTPANIDDPGGAIGWTFTPVTPDTAVQEIVTAVVFYLVDEFGSFGGGTNPVMFATTQGIGNTVIHSGSVFGQYQLLSVTGGNSRILTVDPSASPPTFAAAHTLLAPALTKWEGAHAQHLWLEPQRTNMLINPSFESDIDNGWRTYSPSAAVEVPATWDDPGATWDDPDSLWDA